MLWSMGLQRIRHNLVTGQQRQLKFDLLGFLSGLVVDNTLRHYPRVWATPMGDSILDCASGEMFQLTGLTSAPSSSFFSSFIQ